MIVLAFAFVLLAVGCPPPPPEPRVQAPHIEQSPPIDQETPTP